MRMFCLTRSADDAYSVGSVAGQRGVLNQWLVLKTNDWETVNLLFGGYAHAKARGATVSAAEPTK